MRSLDINFEYIIFNLKKNKTYFFIYIYKNANIVWKSNISIFKEFYVSRGGRHSPLAVIEICERRVYYTLCKFINR